MKRSVLFVTIIGQALVALLWSHLALMQIGGKGWMIFAPVVAGATIGAWATGATINQFSKSTTNFDGTRRLAGSFCGALLGVAVILLTPPAPFTQLLYPALGAALGYHAFARRHVVNQ